MRVRKKVPKPHVKHDSFTNELVRCNGHCIEHCQWCGATIPVNPDHICDNCLEQRMRIVEARRKYYNYETKTIINSWNSH